MSELNDDKTPPPTTESDWKMQQPGPIKESDNFFDQLARQKEDRKIRFLNRMMWLCFLLGGFLVFWSLFLCKRC